MSTTGVSNIALHLSGDGGRRRAYVWPDVCRNFEEFMAEVYKAVGPEPVVNDVLFEGSYIPVPDWISFRDLWDIHEVLCEITNDETPAFLDYLEYTGDLKYARETFGNAYRGWYQSLEDFAWNVAEDVYPSIAACPPGFRIEVDLIAWECDYHISPNGYVFRKV